MVFSISALEPLLSFEAEKFAPSPFPQPFQDYPHFGQFSLQAFTSIWRCTGVKFNVYFGLNLARFLCCILAHSLSNELDVKRCLHKSRKRVLRPLFKCFEKCQTYLFKEIRENLIGQGCCSCRDFSMHVDQEQ